MATGTGPRIIQVEEKLPFLETIPLSLQHLFAMFGATVLVPFLLHVDPATSLLMNGVGTLVYLTVTRGKIPAYLGSSFAFIAPVLAVLAVPALGGYAAAQGGFIVFGLFFILISFIVQQAGTRWLEVVFPPAAMGAVVAIIGLELAPTAAQMAGLVQGPATSPLPHGLSMVVSLSTLAVVILVSLFARGFFSIIPVLVGVVAGYGLSLYLGLVDIAAIRSAPWFAVPHLYRPVFNLQAIMMIFPACFVVLAEHIGHLVVTGNIVDRELMKDPGLHRSLLGDGLSNVLSGLTGATPNTTYGENIGVMAITRVFSVWVIGGAACIAVVISFIGKIGAVIRSIPAPVMGGVCLLLFGVIAAAGIRMIIEKKVDYTRPSNLILTAVTFVVGISGAKITLGHVALQGMALATVVAILLGLVVWVGEMCAPGTAAAAEPE
ncbi:uracil permease [Mesoterricola silvestris]|uniref:Uracil/xanthine transporter n=1 Tax=Mesoterricola silvestris TaxID=2927979 RepID=A0AA48GJ96_9BACT|nr:uracil permease [Mesoterricola silvestris]BDU74021.1 uracil/xanthine transporter [Mesoterricola silvestris]